MSQTSKVPKPTYYVKALDGEFSEWAFSEEKAPQFRGRWRSEIFQDTEQSCLDLEIGTGNGFHFSHYAQSRPNRNLLGIELKYKPLIQSIRRALRAGAENARMVRYDAAFLQHLFAASELNDVFIQFPDPWVKRSRNKHRLIQDDFLLKLFSMQRSGSLLQFKTDNRDYFDWAVDRFNQSPYEVQWLTYDLHQSEWAQNNFVTHFESIFLRQGLPIHQIELKKT